MNLFESLKSAIDNIKANKLRSILTMLGIIIGISSVITIVSIGQGGKKYITNQFESIGTNLISVQLKPANNDITFSDYFTLEDAKIIEDKIPKVDYVAPFNEDFGRIRYENGVKRAQIVASTEKYIKIANLSIIKGRFINKHDLDTQRMVCVIDDITAQKLFKSKNAVGKQIRLSIKDNNLNALVVGIVKNPNGNLASTFGENYPGFVIIPITISERILPDSRIGYMFVMLKDMINSKETASKIVRLLEIRHRNSGKYAAEEGFKQLDMVNKIINTFTAVIGAIAGISLLVGGIGVMNIMLVSVTERTREIGIRKAIGARQRDIKLQFLTESIILCLIGGIIGMILGITIGYIAGSIINIPFVLSPTVVLISFLFSSAVGIFFGLYPANKAAKLDPIEALRYE